MNAIPLHDADFHTWTREQADLLRAGRWDAPDTAHLICEESL